MMLKGKRYWEAIISVFKVFFQTELTHCYLQPLTIFKSNLFVVTSNSNYSNNFSLKCLRYQEPSEHGNRDHSFAFFAHI